jgi:hypothetical protein
MDFPPESNNKYTKEAGKRRCVSRILFPPSRLKTRFGGRRQLLYAAYPGKRIGAFPPAVIPFRETFRHMPSIWPCSWRGLQCRFPCGKARWALTPPFHPCPEPVEGLTPFEKPTAVYFLLHYPSRGFNPRAPRLSAGTMLQ